MTLRPPSSAGAVVLALACSGADPPGSGISPGPSSTGSTATTGDTAVVTSDPVVYPEHLFDDDHVLVVPDHLGVTLLANDTSVLLFRTWDALVGDCAECGGE